jgi:hypothetical protein
MEVVALKVSDVDSKRMMLRVEQGKGGKDPQHRHDRVDGRRPDPRRGEVQLECTQVFGSRGVRRTTEKGSELLD